MDLLSDLFHEYEQMTEQQSLRSLAVVNISKDELNFEL